MKRLLIGVGVAMSAIAIVAGVSGGPGTASAEGPNIDLNIALSSLDELAGLELDDISELPEPQPAAEPANPPAAPVEQPSLGNDSSLNPAATDPGSQPAAPSGAAGPITLPAAGAGAGAADGMLVVAGFAVVFALAGAACLGGARALEAVRQRDRS